VSADLRIGLVGLGKIARDQHLPAIEMTPGARLLSVASRNAQADDLVSFADLETMLAEGPEIDAVILCQPPQARYEAARTAVTEVEALVTIASQQGVTLYASWHSRYALGVERARAWIAGTRVSGITINWKEDVRHWHPGQTWIWEPGGFGVFDPGINALSILTAIVGEPVRLIAASMETPSNCHAPIAADLTMATASGVPIKAVFDFRQTGPQSWDIIVDGDTGNLVLGHGGNVLSINGDTLETAGLEAEYPAMYRRFVQLIAEGRSDVDIAPLRLVADAFLCGRNVLTEPFHD